MLKQIKEQALTHQCGGLNRSYYLNELFQHMASECTEAQKICPNCREEFLEAKDCFKHIKKNCEIVALECDACNKVLPRHKFKEHICYLKTAAFREVIALKLS
jgi:hypothetical protein